MPAGAVKGAVSNSDVTGRQNWGVGGVFELDKVAPDVKDTNAVKGNGLCAADLDTRQVFGIGVVIIRIWVGTMQLQVAIS